MGVLKLGVYDGNGYKIEIFPPFTVDDLIPAHPAVLHLDPNITVKAKARELIKYLPTKVETIVSHEPIELEGFLTEEVILSQRMRYEDDWYIDDFGFYVYCYSHVADCEQIKDLRYEQD